MPNYDAGHYFLTVLAPIRPDPEVTGGVSRSRRHLLQDVLTLMPSGERTVQSIGKAPLAPFARTTDHAPVPRTHFARFAILDDVIFNGRVSGNAVLALLRGINPLTPQKVDRLTTPYLIFAAEFDAESGDDAELRSYASHLWSSMEGELRAVFTHCVGFEKVDTETAFFDYLKRCQIETTMPFSDYWSVMPALPEFNYRPYLWAGLAALAVLAYGIWHAHGLLAILALAALITLVIVGVKQISAAGAKPFPKAPAPAPGSGLPTVLKALSTQRHFTAFAATAQALGDTALHEAFGAFLAATQPGDLTAPTQKPGIIGVDAAGAPL